MTPAATGKDDNPSSLMGLSPLSLGLIAAFVFYAILCSSLRFQRLNKLRARYNFLDRASLSEMTNLEAQKIVNQLSQLEFPLFFDLSMRYALFKTYTVDNIGKLLYAISDLAKPDDAAKRYDDSGVLFACYIKFPPGSTLLAQSVARTNYLHNPYIKAGKIRNEDMLYVLFASMSEPVRFVRLYEWRQMADVEVAALATLWKYIGEMLEIDYEAELGKSQWKDGIEFLDDLAEWAARYEDTHMNPCPEIAKLGRVLVELLLSAYPKFMRPLGYKILMVLMSERVRHTFSFPEPGILESALTYNLLLIRKLFVRYLCLPRLTPVTYLDNPDPKTGRIKHYHFLKEPWYTPVTWWTRWGPEALFQRAFGLRIAGDGGPEMKPDGFLFEDVGPRNKMGKGVDETLRLAGAARAKVSGSACPFSRLAKA